MPDRVRIEIAFDGGQIMGALVTPQSADDLERVLATREAESLSLEADDGRYTVALPRIVYVKRFTRETPVGFASG